MMLIAAETNHYKQLNLFLAKHRIYTSLHFFLKVRKITKIKHFNELLLNDQQFIYF